MVLPYASSWEIGCKMPGKSCKARLVRRCLLDQLRFSQRQIFRGTTWLFCSSSPVNIRWSNKSYYLTSLALLTRWTNPTTATLFLRGNCSQPFFSSANSAVTVRICQSVIFDNPSLYIFLMVSKFIRDSGRWMSEMNTQRLQMCSSADWSSCTCLHQGRGLSELQQWTCQLIKSLMVQQKPQIHLMLFAALVGQVSCESLDKHGFERRYSRERMAS